MKRITVAVAAMSVLATAAFGAQQWRNLTDENYYSGPKITADDLAGKVVLVDEWGINCPPCRALLPHMQKLWNANKGKPFVLIGSHRQGREVAKVKELVDANKLTYPVYDYAGLVDEPSNGGGLPHMYVVNHRGKVVFINMWATYCGPCVQELPVFQSFAQEHADDAVVIIVHASDPIDDVPSFLERKNVALTCTVDSLDDYIFNLCGASPSILPHTVVLNRKGEIVYNQSGSITDALLDEQYEKAK